MNRDGDEASQAPLPMSGSIDGDATQSERTVVSHHTGLGRSLPGRTLQVTDAHGDDVPARQVGRYQILAKLGEGAMATVYKAFDPSIGRALVIKFLHADLCVDAEYRTRFLREAKAAGALSHANIVTVFDVGEIEGRPYIAMELVDGGPLSDQLKKGAGLPLREVVRIGMQVANALDYAHSHGIFHRDIKPSNLLLLKDSATVKVADFGIAHMAGQDAGDRTRVGTVIGTPHYMSPEQAMGAKIDGRSDLFSLGVVLYQLITGARPFEADSMVTLAHRIAREEPRPIDELRRDVPPALRRIVDRCLRKQSNKRFQTGRELADALGRIGRDMDEEADGAGRPRGIPLKLKLALGMAALVVVTMAVTSVFVTQRQYRTLLAQTLDHGASLTKMIAVESAASALSEDWVGIDVFVQEVARELSLKSLVVSDSHDVVHVSAGPAAVGKIAEPLNGEELATAERGVRVQRSLSQGRDPVFVFEAPITFQSKRVGTVRLSLPEAPLAAAARESLLLLGLLLVVTAATVGLATYLLAEHYARSLRLLRESLDEIRNGRYGYRIAEKRADEFGQVYSAFDAMAARLERDAPVMADASPPEGKQER
ncbi:MAG: protein kinase domain-containing protein [Gemmatimonadota bacterium]